MIDRRRFIGTTALGSAALAVGPTAYLDYMHQNQSSFAERGAGSLSLRVGSRDLDSIESGLGLLFRITHESLTLGDTRIVPELSARWVREWLDSDRSISVSLSGAPRFSVTTDDPRRNSAELGFGLRGYFGESFNLGLSYDASLTKDNTSHRLEAGVEFRF